MKNLLKGLFSITLLIGQFCKNMFYNVLRYVNIALVRGRIKILFIAQRQKTKEGMHTQTILQSSNKRLQEYLDAKSRLSLTQFKKSN